MKPPNPRPDPKTLVAPTPNTSSESIYEGFKPAPKGGGKPNP
ncbi:MAG: hypothetical protein WAN59_09670 [Candidatus Baltobacteraceae bacterium]